MLVYLSMQTRPLALRTIDIHFTFIHEGEGHFLDRRTILTDDAVAFQITFHGFPFHVNGGPLTRLGVSPYLVPAHLATGQRLDLVVTTVRPSPHQSETA